MTKWRLGLVALWIVLGSAGIVRPCTSVVVGRNASRDGSVIFGHNEDDSGTRVVNAWKVPRIRHEPADSVRLREGGVVAQVPETWSMIWFQVNGLEFSDYYCNEWGVAVASDACPSREDKPELTDGGIGFSLRRIVAERAKTAREGVKIAGRMLDRFGYASSGRTLVICDPMEGWLLSMVAGKHWIARRVPDDGVTVLANAYVIREADLSDSSDFIASGDDIAGYARSRGWWSPDMDGPFDFAKAYREQNSGSGAAMKGNVDLRQWRGLSVLSGGTLPEGGANQNSLPFFLTPKRKISIEDVMKVLRDHYEGTKVEASLLGCGNPHACGERPICCRTTLFSIVARLSRAVPLPLRACLWVAFGRPDTSPYTPWYASISDVPEGFHGTPGIVSPDLALSRHFNPVPGTFAHDSSDAFWIFKVLADRTGERYFENIPAVRESINIFEKKIFASFGDIESEASNRALKDPEGAVEYLTRMTRLFARESIENTQKLIRGIGPPRRP
jgi:dipeptidase